MSDYQIERFEAIHAGEVAIKSLKEVLNHLKGAKNWGLYDMLGGGFITSLIKHSKIDNAKVSLEKAKRDLRNFKIELSDISMNLNIDIDIILVAFDFMDSLIADVLVQSKISESYSKIQEALFKVEDIVARLKAGW